jgi:hypothetical protein
MKLARKTTLMVLSITLLMVSCKKSNNSFETNEPNIEASSHTEADWETTDPEVMRAIMAEVNENRANGRAATETYRNFKLETNSGTPADIIAIVKKEIDTIYLAGLRTATIEKMDNVAVIYLASGKRKGLMYDPGSNTVVINDYESIRTIKKNATSITLHELTHFFHDEYIPGGFSNTTNNNNFMAARQNKIYAADSYVLKNSGEYLATSTEAYFTGTSREPYTKARVTSKDPNTATFIKDNF